MIRIAPALSLLGLACLALAACAAKPPAPPAPQAVVGDQVYQDLKLQHFEQQMLTDDNKLTYGNAVVACGLRSQQWLTVLQTVYLRDYSTELQKIPLSYQQAVAARTYAGEHMQQPTPPELICNMMEKDTALADLDFAVAAESYILATSNGQPAPPNAPIVTLQH